MAVGYPDTYVILMLFRRDLLAGERDKPIEEITWADLRVTRKDAERSDRVDFIDLDGTCRTLKQRNQHEEFPKKARSIVRPESFDFLKVRDAMPWWNGLY
jgi:hypothetical protein